MLKRFYPIFVLMMGLFLISLSGCQSANSASDAESSTQTEGKQIELYYLNADGNGFEKVPYMMKNPDDPYLAALEVIYMLSNKEDSTASNYKVVITQDVVVNQVEVEDGELMVDLGQDYYLLSAVDSALVRASLVLSSVQIDGIDSVSFTINGDDLLGTDENPVGTMDADSFILEENEEEMYEQEKEVTLYYANKTGDGLIAYHTTVKAEENTTMETAVLMALKYVPEELSESGAISPVPSNLIICQTQMENSTCYVNLSEEIENEFLGVEEKIMVYSMVNTLTSLEGISTVRFTVEGETVESIRSFEGFQLLMTSDNSLSVDEVEGSE